MHHSPPLKQTTFRLLDGSDWAYRHLVRLPALTVVTLIKTYKTLVSPLFTGCCRFHPSCSTYMAEAVLAHGARRGIVLGLRRLVRCRPWGGHGFDPLPPS
jgi:uncharacterized protein